MNKNAVVLLLAVLFMAMVLVVVNQMLYSDSTQSFLSSNSSSASSSVPSSVQGTGNNMDNTPLSSSDERPGPSVPASAFPPSEPSPWARDVERNNNAIAAANTNSSRAAEAQVPVQHENNVNGVVQNAPQNSYNDVARQMLDSGSAKTPSATANNNPAVKTERESQIVIPNKIVTASKAEPVRVDPQSKVETSTPEAPKRPKKSGPATIEKIGVHFADKKMVLRVTGDTGFEIKWFLLTGPDRLVVDFPEPVKNLTVPNIPENRIVKGARLGKQKDGFRLVLDLHSAVKVQAKNDKAGNLEVFME